MIQTIFVLLLASTLANTHGQPTDSAQQEAQEPKEHIRESIVIKLRPVPRRKKSELRALATRLEALPGLEGCSVAPVAANSLVLVLPKEHDTEQVKEVLLSQAEVYEVEVREEQHRRPGDVRSHDALKQDMLEEAKATTRRRLKDVIKDKLRAMLLGKRRRAAEAEVEAHGGQQATGVEEEVAEVMRAAKRLARQEARRLQEVKRHKRKREQVANDSQQQVEL